MGYHLIESIPQLKEFIARIIESGKPFGLDTETNGLRPEIGNRMVGFSISMGTDREKDDHFYVALRHKAFQGTGDLFDTPVDPVTVNLPIDEVREAVKPLFEHPTIPKVFFNAKFDLKFFKVDNIPVSRPIDDGIILAHLLEPDNEAKGGKLKLKALGERVLGEKPEDQSALKNHILSMFPGESEPMSKMEYTDPNICCQYACSDTRLTLALYEHYTPLLVKDPRLVENYDAEIEDSVGLVDTELRGIIIRKDFLVENAEKTEREQDVLLAEIRKESGLANFNPRSGSQIYGLFFDILGLPLPKSDRGRSGKVSFDKEVLDGIDHPLAKKIKDYNSRQTKRSTYFVGLQKWITDEGTIHPNLSQIGTPTARFSCYQPNLQNQPPEMRPAFETRKNYRIWFWDYSQIEMRIFAHYSGDALLLQGYRDQGAAFDAHGSMAAELGITRKHGKTINFLILFGGGAKKLGANLNISTPEASAILQKYYARFPGVQLLRTRAKQKIESRATEAARDPSKVLKWGYLTDQFGRYYYLPRDRSYIAVNRLVQGCAANLMKRGMSRVFPIIAEMRKEYGPDAATLLLNIHDEIWIEIRKDIPNVEGIWIPRITKAMEDFPQFKVPILATLKVTDSTWAEAKEFEVVR